MPYCQFLVFMFVNVLFLRFPRPQHLERLDRQTIRLKSLVYCW
jgi:hypothetical protein